MSDIARHVDTSFLTKSYFQIPGSKVRLKLVTFWVSGYLEGALLVPESVLISEMELDSCLNVFKSSERIMAGRRFSFRFPVSLRLRLKGWIRDRGLGHSCLSTGCVSDIEVVRPEMPEFTALGAAFAAGKAVGLWEPGRASGNTQKIFRPIKSPQWRDEKLTNWHKSLEKSLNEEPLRLRNTHV